MRVLFLNLKISFSWIGLAVFALPMLINIVYAVFLPSEAPKQAAVVPRRLEIVEQVSRIAYLAAITFLVSGEPIDFQSICFWLATLFLLLYYVVWIRYFAGGRKANLLNRSFLFVPMPLAVFPVLYFLCAAGWLHNVPAAVIIVVFGAAHLVVSFKSFG